jgi:hypothetical protein
MMNWKGCERKRLWPYLRYCSDICLEELRKTMKHIQDNRSPGRDLKAGPSEYDAERILV